MRRTPTDAFWVHECIDLLKNESKVELGRLQALTAQSLDLEFEDLRARLLSGLRIGQEVKNGSLEGPHEGASRFGGGRFLSGMPNVRPKGDDEAACAPQKAPPKMLSAVVHEDPEHSIPVDVGGCDSHVNGEDVGADGKAKKGVPLIDEVVSRDVSRGSGKASLQEAKKGVQRFDGVSSRELSRGSDKAPLQEAANKRNQSSAVPGQSAWSKPVPRVGKGKQSKVPRNSEDASDLSAEAALRAAERLNRLQPTRFSGGNSGSRQTELAASLPSDESQVRGSGRQQKTGRKTLAQRLEIAEQAKQAQRKSGEEQKLKQTLGDGTASLRSGIPWLRQFVHGVAFNIVSGLIIIGGAVFTGVQVNIAVEASFAGRSSATEGVAWVAAEWFIIFLYTLEIILRIVGHGLDYFRVQGEWGWNLFDSLILVVCIVQQAVESFAAMPFLRLVRIVRVLRVLKVLHLINFFKRLGKMMVSVLASMNALAPAVVLLGLVMYVFSISLLQGIGLWLEEQEDDRGPPELAARFGNLGRAMKTLFMSSTGGISWVECIDALATMNNHYDEFYFFYVTFVNICVLNIVTGIFVDTVHQMYTPEREELVEAERDTRARAAANLMHLFEEADEDGSGVISWDEFEAFLSIEQVRTYFQSLELDVTHVREVFDLMDMDGSGEVGVDEFVQGFLEMKGAAKGVDVTVIKHQMMKISSQVNYLRADVLGELTYLKESTVAALDKAALKRLPEVNVY